MQRSECVLIWGSTPIFATRNLGETKLNGEGEKPLTG